MFPGDIGYCYEVQKEGKIDLSTLKWSQNHGQTHHGLGLGGAHDAQRNIFTQLPGRTFNAKSLAAYTQQVHAVHRGTVSPIKSRRTQ